MKLAQIAIGSILFIEAFFLMYLAQQRYNMHSFFHLLKNQYQDCQLLQNLCFDCIEKIRFFLVAFIFTGAFSLTLGSNVYVGLIAQLLWTIFQSESYYSYGLTETRDTLIQVVFIFVLFSEAIKECKECEKPKQEHKIKRSREETMEAVPLGEESSKHVKQEKKFQRQQEKKVQKPQKEVKEVKEVKESPEKTKSRSQRGK